MSDQANTSTDRPKILAIDDDPSILSVLGELLEPEFDVSVLTSGKNVLAVAEEIHPDLILLDIEMPAMNGYAVCKQLKSHPEFADIPLIFLTVKADSVSQILGLQLGAVDYVSKPFDPWVLHQRIRNQLQVKAYLDYQKQQVRQYKSELEQSANQAHSKELFFARLSHELRTPVNAIVVALERALTQAEDSQLSALLKKTDQASQHLLNLINDILDITQIESDSLTLLPEPFVLKDVVESLNDTLSFLAEKKRLILTFVVDEHLNNKTWVCDRKRLLQVMINLIGNAIKFTSKGGVIVTIKPQLQIEDQSYQLYCEVADTGMGIPIEDQARIFEMYQKMNTSSSDQGTGLGLAISQRLVKAMGGELELKSDVGLGSQFSFSIPLPLADLSEISSNDASKEPSDTVLQDKLHDAKILLVEDSWFLQELIADILESTGSMITQAMNGIEAVAKAREQTFDIILMDVEMPQMDGIQATQKIRQLPGYDQTPVLGLTGNTVTQDHQLCIEAGMNEVFVKPILYETLHRALLKWLGRLPA